MSTQDPEQIRRNIEQTRANLSSDVNALADEAKPSNVANRQVNKVKEGARNLKDKVMGSDDQDDTYPDRYTRGQFVAGSDHPGPNSGDRSRHGEHEARQRLGDAGDRVQEGVGRAGERAQQGLDEARHGLARAGDRAGSAVQDAPHRVRQGTRGNPLAAGLIAFGLGALVGGLVPSTSKERQAAAEVQDRAQPALREAQGVAQDVADNLREPAQEAVENVKDSAADSARNVKESGRSQAEDLQAHAQESKDTVQDNRN